MSKHIESKTIKTGRHAELTAFADDRYVKCRRCGFVLNIDRHQRAKIGSRAGDGLGDVTTGNYGLGDDYKWGKHYWGYFPWGYILQYYGEPTVDAGCPFCGLLTFDSLKIYER